MVNPQMVMYEEEFNQIKQVISKLRIDANAKVVFLVDKNGQLIAGCGETEHLDTHRGGRLANGYTALRRDGSRERVPPYHVRGIGPAAGFTSTVEDLGRFASWQFRVLAGEGDGVLDADTLREMQRVQWMDPDWKTSRGLGFAIWRSGEQTFVGHGGYCPGYQSQLLLQPAAKVATVFMTNSNGIDSRAFAQTAGRGGYGRRPWHLAPSTCPCCTRGRPRPRPHRPRARCCCRPRTG